MDIKKLVHWLLALVAVLMVVSGYGITEFRFIEEVTFGILTKSTAFRLHEFLAIPFIILAIAHAYLELKG